MRRFAFKSFVGRLAIFAHLPFVDDRGCVLDHPRDYIVIARYSHSDARLERQFEGPYLTFYGLDSSLDDSIRARASYRRCFMNGSSGISTRRGYGLDAAAQEGTDAFKQFYLRGRRPPLCYIVENIHYGRLFVRLQDHIGISQTNFFQEAETSFDWKFNRCPFSWEPSSPRPSSMLSPWQREFSLSVLPSFP